MNLNISSLKKPKAGRPSTGSQCVTDSGPAEGAGCFFYLKWALNQEITGPTGVVPSACNSWCIHRLCLMGKCATAGTGVGRPDGPIELENLPEWELGGSAACGALLFMVIHVIYKYKNR